MSAQTAWDTWLAIQEQERALPAASGLATKPKRAVAWDAGYPDRVTDQVMVRVLFQATDLISQYRRWQRAARALDKKLEDPALADHPKRPAAVQRWEQAVDRVALIGLSLWELAPAAAAAWRSYSPARRSELARGGRWPPVEGSIDETAGWLRDEWLAIAHEGGQQA